MATFLDKGSTEDEIQTYSNDNWDFRVLLMQTLRAPVSQFHETCKGACLDIAMAQTDLQNWKIWKNPYIIGQIMSMMWIMYVFLSFFLNALVNRQTLRSLQLPLGPPEAGDI